MTTSYANIGGSGERRPWVTTSGTLTFASGDATHMINGLTGTNDAWINSGQSTATLIFDFGSSNSPVIDEFTWFQDGSHSQGTWKFSGSPDNSTWTDLLTGINLGNAAAADVHAVTNSTGYRYYRLAQTGGSTSSSPYTRQINFKISGIDASGPTTWSPLYATPSITTLSGGDLTVSSTSGTGSSIATFNALTGKFYYEYTPTGMDDNNSGIGVADITFTPQARGGQSANPHSGIVVSNSYFVYSDGSYASLTLTSGTVLCVAIDIGAQLIWFRFDGHDWNNDASANPATGAGGLSLSFMDASHPVAPSFVSSDAVFAGTANFGATSYAQTPPSGFNNWIGAADTGTFAATEATDTFAATGHRTHTGTMAVTGAIDTMSFAGFEGVQGTWTPTEATDIMVATGTLGSFSGVIGYMTPTEATDVISVTMVITISATMILSEGADTFNAFGKITVTGTWTPTEAKDHLSFTGTVLSINGTWASQEPVDTFAAAGKVPVVGTFTPTENIDTISVVVFGAPVPLKRRIFFTT